MLFGVTVVLTNSWRATGRIRGERETARDNVVTLRENGTFREGFGKMDVPVLTFGCSRGARKEKVKYEG